MNSAGTAPSICKPSKSFTWVQKMVTAMPEVKPVVTGNGMNLMRDPILNTPKRMRKSPASSVHITNPLKPKLATTPAIITTKAPVGPPIWNLLPPSSDIINPATTAVTRPVEGVISEHPQAMAKAMASGKATTPTVRPDVRSAKNVLRLYSRRDLKRLGACMSPQTIRPPTC